MFGIYCFGAGNFTVNGRICRGFLAFTDIQQVFGNHGINRCFRKTSVCEEKKKKRSQQTMENTCLSRVEHYHMGVPGL